MFAVLQPSTEGVCSIILQAFFWGCVCGGGLLQWRNNLSNKYSHTFCAVMFLCVLCVSHAIRLCKNGSKMGKNVFEDVKSGVDIWRRDVPLKSYFYERRVD